MSRTELEDLLSKKPTKHKPALINNTGKFENTPQDYKPKIIAGAFNEKYIEYINEGHEKLIKEHFKKIKTIFK